MRIGLYPGSFDPITYGHIDIVRRAAGLVDRLVIGVAASRGKTPMFDLKSRVQMVAEECAQLEQQTGIEIIARPFDNLLIEFAQEVNASLLIRGLRAVSDFEYEFQMVGMNRMLTDSIETVFLMADTRHQAIAAKLVREIARMGGNVSKFVSPAVQVALQEKNTPAS